MRGPLQKALAVTRLSVHGFRHGGLRAASPRGSLSPAPIRAAAPGPGEQTLPPDSSPIWAFKAPSLSDTHPPRPPLPHLPSLLFPMTLILRVLGGEVELLEYSRQTDRQTDALGPLALATPASFLGPPLLRHAEGACLLHLELPGNTPSRALAKDTPGSWKELVRAPPGDQGPPARSCTIPVPSPEGSCHPHSRSRQPPTPGPPWPANPVLLLLCPC